jgi:hypothetical protein
MEQLLLVSFIVCYCSSLLLTLCIMSVDVVRLQFNRDTYFEKILRTVPHLVQIAITLHTGVQANWVALFVTTLEANVTMIVQCFLKDV